MRAGEGDAALEAFAKALSLLGTDSLDAARIHNNRGNVHLQRGVARSAALDYEQASSIFREHGEDVEAAKVEHNLGLTHLLNGDIVAALVQMDRARAVLAAPVTGVRRCLRPGPRRGAVGGRSDERRRRDVALGGARPRRARHAAAPGRSRAQPVAAAPPHRRQGGAGDRTQAREPLRATGQRGVGARGRRRSAAAIAYRAGEPASRRTHWSPSSSSTGCAETPSWWRCTKRASSSTG